MEQAGEEYLGLVKAAAVAGVAFNTFKKALKSGEIPQYKTKGRRRVVKRSEVEAWSSPTPIAPLRKVAPSPPPPPVIASVFPRVALDT